MFCELLLAGDAPGPASGPLRGGFGAGPAGQHNGPMPAPQPSPARPRTGSGRGGGLLGSLLFPLVLAITVGAGVATALSSPPLGVWIFVTVMGGWLVTLCLHEFGHAVTALAGGDTSVRQRGYLTLNPLRYANGAMTFALPLIILAIGGIPLPGGAVLIEHHRLRSRMWRSAVSAAGPLVNVLAGVLLAAVGASIASPLGYALSFLGLLQFTVAILNLLPVPGLDGWGVLAPHLSPATTAAVRPFTPWAPLVLIVVLFSLPQASRPLWDAAYWLFGMAGGNDRSAAIGSVLFRFWS